MKLSCSRSALLSAWQVVSAIVPTRTPKEILRNVKLTVAGGKATLLATDQEVGVRYELNDVETSSVGEVLLPTQRFANILREVQDDRVQIEVVEDALWVRTSHSEFRLSVENPAEFPDVATFTDENYYVLQGKTLKQGIQRTVFATDVESTRYALGGVLMELRSEHLTLAATDSRRLAVYKTTSATRGNVSEEIGQPVVPSKAMSLIERSIHDDDQEIFIAVHNNDVLVKTGSTTVYARLVEGRFPRYQDVMPKEFGITIDLVSGPFLSAVRQAMIVTNEESRGVDFTFGDGMLTLTSVGQDVGSSKIQMPVSYDGEEVVITFDPRFIADFLKVLDSAAAVSLNLVDGNSAAVFMAEDNYKYVVMPLARDDR
jgi:DNA polymerase-3 subunit beta